jgi:periplasmic protein TonB
MKIKNLMLLALMLNSSIILAQTDTSTTESNKSVVITVDEAPKPKKGMESFYQWFSQTVKYPIEARKKGIEGRVYAQFFVEEDGSLSNIKITQGIGGGCDEETIRVLSTSPKWIPAKYKGKVVRCGMKLPFRFRLE